MNKKTKQIIFKAMAIPLFCLIMFALATIMIGPMCFGDMTPTWFYWAWGVLALSFLMSIPFISDIETAIAKWIQE